MKDNTQNNTNPAMIVELVDSVVKPLMVVSDELSEVKKGLSKIQTAFEGLTYQEASLKDQLEIENKTLAKERAALELVSKKFNANLADLENLTETLSHEVRSGIKSASKVLSDAIRHEVDASLRKTIDASSGALCEAVQKNIKLLNSRENSALWSSIIWMALSVASAFFIMSFTHYYFRKHITHLPCLNTCICEVAESKDTGQKQATPSKRGIFDNDR